MEIQNKRRKMTAALLYKKFHIIGRILGMYLFKEFIGSDLV